MSGGYSKKPEIHDSEGNPQRTIGQGDYEKSRKENEERLLHRAAFPTQRAQLMHIFRKAPGHFQNDTEENRKLILTAVSAENYFGTAKYRKRHYYKNVASAEGGERQVWVYVRGGIIEDAGINDRPLPEEDIEKIINGK